MIHVVKNAVRDALSFRVALYARVLIFIQILALCSCAAFSGKQADYPLLSRTLAPVLPMEQEATATLRVSRGDSTEEYILALRATREGLRAALLSPHGVPQFTVYFQNGERKKSTQANTGELLTATLLADYLQLIYLSEDSISKVLKKDWCLQTRLETGVGSTRESGPLERHLLRGCSAEQPLPAYRVRYAGSAPWYGTIEILDVPRGQKVTMTILDTNHREN